MNNNSTENKCIPQYESTTCTSVVSQCADVSVPIKLKPYVLIGKVAAECCGEPIITLRQNQVVNCSCTCEITITQTVCMRVSLEYGTEIDVGDTRSTCASTLRCNNAQY